MMQSTTLSLFNSDSVTVCNQQFLDPWTPFLFWFLQRSSPTRFATSVSDLLKVVFVWPLQPLQFPLGVISLRKQLCSRKTRVMNLYSFYYRQWRKCLCEPTCYQVSFVSIHWSVWFALNSVNASITNNTSIYWASDPAPSGRGGLHVDSDGGTTVVSSAGPFAVGSGPRGWSTVVVWTTQRWRWV